MKTKSNKKKGKVGKNKASSSRLLAGFAQKKPILKFALAFALGIFVFYSIYFSDFFTDSIAKYIVNGQAAISSFLLNIFGFATTTSGSLILDGPVILDIKKGCDGIEPTFFFLMGVLLVPFSKKAKMTGLFVGLVVLSLLNILRICGLFAAGYYWPQAFDLLHLHGGFTLFFIVTIIVWVIWANWAIGLPKIKSDEENTV